jgi:hypothetical protein
MKLRSIYFLYFIIYYYVLFQGVVQHFFVFLFLYIFKKI